MRDRQLVYISLEPLRREGSPPRYAHSFKLSWFRFSRRSPLSIHGVTSIRFLPCPERCHGTFRLTIECIIFGLILSRYCRRIFESMKATTLLNYIRKSSSDDNQLRIEGKAAACVSNYNRDRAGADPLCSCADHLCYVLCVHP